MADLTSDQAIEKLRALPEDKQRAVLTALSPEERSGIIGKLKAPGAKIPATPAAAKQSAYERLTSGYDPGAAAFDEKHPVIGKGVRALSSLGGTVLGLPGGIYHGIADPVTPEEKAAGRSHLEAIPERLLGGEAAANAIQDYKSGKVSLRGAVSVLPEALGAGAGTVIGAELGGEALSKVGRLRKSAAEGIQPVARKVTGVETAVKEQVGKAAEKHAEAMTENKAKRLETFKENMRTQSEANTKIAREKMAIGEKNKGIEAENKAQAAQVAKRGELAKAVDQQSNQLGEHISKVEDSVGREANRKFQEVRAKIGNPEVDTEHLVGVVKNAKEKILQGIPENIKEFNAVLSHESPPDHLAEAYEKAVGEPLEGPDPLTWDKLQSIKSRIDARLRAARSRPMNGDLKRALYSVRNGIVDSMGEVAEENGAGEEWVEARDFWRQYKEDFHEPTGPSGSGSPVAQALDAVDPKNIRQPFLRTQATTGNRATQILRKYPQHGGTEAATHAENLIKSHQEMMGLPEKESPKAQKQYPEVHQMPGRKAAPRVPESPVVDIAKVSREKIAQVAKNWGSFNARDVGILGSSFAGEVVGSIFGHGFAGAVIGPIGYESAKFGMSRVLNKPAVVEWLARTPPEEIAVLNKIPGADKVKLVNGITETAIQNKATNLSPAMKSLLGPANVARIMAVTGASQAQNPADAKQRMRQFAPASN